MTGTRGLTVEAAPRFQPDRLKDVSPLKGGDRRFRLTDVEGRSATIQAPMPIEPVSEEGRLAIRVGSPKTDRENGGQLVGQVVDRQGRPVAAANLALHVNLGSTHGHGAGKSPSGPRTRTGDTICAMYRAEPLMGDQ